MSYFVSVFLVNVALFNAVSIMGRFPEANYWSVIYTESLNILHADQSGWTKDKVDNLWQTESFVKETMRFVGDACFEMRRKVRNEKKKERKLKIGSISLLLIANCFLLSFLDPGYGSHWHQPFRRHPFTVRHYGGASFQRHTQRRSLLSASYLVRRFALSEAPRE